MLDDSFDKAIELTLENLLVLDPGVHERLEESNAEILRNLGLEETPTNYIRLLELSKQDVEADEDSVEKRVLLRVFDMHIEFYQRKLASMN
jgi:hypothetical protein